MIETNTNNKLKKNLFVSLGVLLFLGSLFLLSTKTIRNENLFYKKIILFLEENPNCNNAKGIIKNAFNDNLVSIKESSLINWEIKDCLKSKYNKDKFTEEGSEENTNELVLKIKTLTK